MLLIYIYIFFFKYHAFFTSRKTEKKKINQTQNPRVVKLRDSFKKKKF